MLLLASAVRCVRLLFVALAFGVVVVYRARIAVSIVVCYRCCWLVLLLSIVVVVVCFIVLLVLVVCWCFLT